MDKIMLCINKLVGIRAREVQDKCDTLICVFNALTEELESVNHENASVSACRDMLLKELDLERKWIRPLESMLKDNNITLPKYPRRM